MDNRSSSPGGILDNTAIALSGLCLVHCLSLPVLIALLPLLNRLDPQHFPLQMLIVAVPVSLFAFTIGFRRHRNQAIALAGISGIAIMVAGGTVGHANFGAVADAVMTVAGSTVLAAAHYFNNRLTRHVAIRGT